MAVVCIIAILATAATYGVMKYVHAAKISEAVEIINSIRASQEAYKDETFGYKKVATLGAYYPFGDTASLKNAKKSWDAGNATVKLAWDELGVHPSGVVEFGFDCDAGKNTGIPQMATLGVTQNLNFPDSATDWYVARAVGDRDGNGVLATVVGSSFNDQVYIENDTE